MIPLVLQSVSLVQKTGIIQLHLKPGRPCKLGTLEGSYRQQVSKAIIFSGPSGSISGFVPLLIEVDPVTVTQAEAASATFHPYEVWLDNTDGPYLVLEEVLRKLINANQR